MNKPTYFGLSSSDRYKKIRRARDFMLKANSYDETLWNFFEDKGDSFNGDAKELNQYFVVGCNRYLDNEEEFYIYDKGWINACGWSVITLAEHICKQEVNDER